MARQHKVNKTGLLISCFDSFQNARKQDQHFVPRCVLRPFGLDAADHAINLSLLTARRRFKLRR
jgi:hypothetical protein